MLVRVCTVCVRVLKMLTPYRENGVFGVVVCSLILFHCTFKIKISRLKCNKNTSKMMSQFTTMQYL